MKKKVSNRKKYTYMNGVMGKKEAIKEALEKAMVANDVETFEKNNFKIYMFMGACAILGLLTIKIPASILFGCGLAAGAITMIVNYVDSTLRIKLHQKQAKKAYNEMINDCETIGNKLEREVVPMLSSYLLETPENDNKYSVATNVYSANQDTKAVAVSDFDGKVVAVKYDRFMQMALELDAIICALQYKGYEDDAEQLRDLVIDYSLLMSENEAYNVQEYSKRESECYVELGSLYAIVKQKREAAYDCMEAELKEDTMILERRLRD